MKKNYILPLLCAALLPTLSSCGQIPEVDFNTFDKDIKAAKKILYDTDSLLEYKYTVDINKQHFDSIIHRYEYMEFEVDLNEDQLIVYFTDDTDDHNGENLFKGKSKFWFWANPVTGALGTAMIADGDCGQSFYNVIDKSFGESMEVLKIKSQLEAPLIGKVGEPMALSYDTTKYLHELYMQTDIKPEKYANTVFTTKSNGKGDFYFEMFEGNIDGEKKKEYREIYEMKNYMITRHYIHTQNEMMYLDVDLKFEYTTVDIKKPTQADIIDHENNRPPKPNQK